MAPLPSLYALLSLTLILISFSSALPVERRRNPLASIILGGSKHDGGRSGVSLGLGLHRPIGLILGKRSDPESQPLPEAVDESGEMMHILPYPFSLEKREAASAGYIPGGPGSGGQYDKGQPYGR